MGNKLQKGWTETELSSILRLKNGYAFKSTDYKEEGIPVIRISDIQDGLITSEKAVCVSEFDRADDFIVEKGDILIAMSGATTGKFGVFNNDYKAYQNQRVGNLKPIDSNVNKKFIYYLIGNLKKVIEEKAYGGAQPNISAKLIEEIKINLPPLNEQQRIVSKLDQIFSHLETAKKGLGKIPVLLKQFRQAVLTQAVTGKLTEEWREGKELGEWKFNRIGEISDFLSGFAFKSSDFVNEGIQLIRMGNLYNNKLDLSRSPVFLPTDYDSKILNKYSVKKGDVLLTLTGTKYKRDYGFAIRIEDDNQLLLNQRILALKPKIYSDYFLIALQQDLFRDQFFEFETGGVNQGNVGVRNVLEIELKIPPIEEQTEIVRRVATLFSKADKIEARYKILKEKIDNLPQTVLTKAFRGEL